MFYDTLLFSLCVRLHRVPVHTSQHVLFSKIHLINFSEEKKLQRIAKKKLIFLCAETIQLAAGGLLKRKRTSSLSNRSMDPVEANDIEVTFDTPIKPLVRAQATRALADPTLTHTLTHSHQLTLVVLSHESKQPSLFS